MASIKLKHSSGNGTILNSPAANPSSDITLKLPSTTGSAGQILKVASANHSSTNAELEFGAEGASGKILQIVQGTTTSTNNYASVDFQNTVVTVNITPVNSSSKFLLKSFVSFGVGANDCPVSFNFSDSLHASGATHALAPMSTDGTNGASGQRLPAYFGIGSFQDVGSLDDYFLGNVYGEFLYTPASANSNQRAFTVMVRSGFGRNVRFNMNAHYNAGDPKDIRATSSIIVMEVGT